MRTETVPFDVVALVRDTVRLYEPNAAGRGIGLDVVIAGMVPAVVAGDPTRLRQVLSNLVSNAIKFTDRGTVTVIVRCSPDTAGAFTLHVEVVDTGLGIAADALAAIFEPFEQGDSSTTRRFGGSGLGLSISRRIVAMLGGQLTCESEPGRGSTFRFSVPLARHVTEAPSNDAATDAAGDQRLHVLMVEDNAVNQLVLQTILGKFGHTVDAAENGKVALGLLATAVYDVVLMDCQMPVMDGYEATAAIRALPGDKARVPIVALTASAMPTDRQRCLDVGMDAYLSKPVNQADLITTLRNVCHSKVKAKVP